LVLCFTHEMTCPSVALKICGGRKNNMAFKNESLINTQELGQAIKRRREELKLSLRDVADVTGVSASTLSRIENGTGRPDADNIARITQWLDMPVDRLMTRHSAKDVEPVTYY